MAATFLDGKYTCNFYGGGGGGGGGNDDGSDAGGGGGLGITPFPNPDPEPEPEPVPEPVPEPETTGDGGGDKPEEASSPPDCLVAAVQFYFLDINVGQIEFKSPVPWFVPGDPLGFSPGGDTQWYRPGFIPDGTTPESTNLFIHETYHNQQGFDMGTTRFRWNYLTSENFRVVVEAEANAAARILTRRVLEDNGGNPPCP